MRNIFRFETMDRLPDGSLPTGGDVYFECTECKGIVSSVPHMVVKCECGNIHGKGGKVVMADSTKVKPLRGRLK